jgi:hypothetical protein
MFLDAWNVIVKTLLNVYHATSLQVWRMISVAVRKERCSLGKIFVLLVKFKAVWSALLLTQRYVKYVTKVQYFEKESVNAKMKDTK